MRGKIIMGAGFLILFLVLSQTAGSVLYKYVDKEGVVHYTDRPDQVPEPYRDQLKRVKTEITIEHKNLFKKIFERKNVSWESLVVFDKEGRVVGINWKKLFWNASLDSRLMIWLAVEFSLLVLLIILLIIIQRNPPTPAPRIVSTRTVKGPGVLLLYQRKTTQKARWTRALAVTIGYLISAGIIFYFFLLPAGKNFIITSQLYLKEIKSEAQIAPPLSDELKALEQKLEEDFKKLP